MNITRKGIIRLSIVLLFTLLVAWLIFGRRGLVHLYEMEIRKETYQEKIRQLEAENDELLAEIKRLRKDKEYIESIARKELNLVKDKEIHYYFAGEDKDPGQDNQVKKEDDGDSAGGATSGTNRD